MLVFFTSLSLIEFWVILGLISSFLSNRQLQVVLVGNSSQEYPVNVRVLQGCIFGPALFLLYIMTILMMFYVLMSSLLMILLSTLSVMRYLICGNKWWLLYLNLIYKMLWTWVRSSLLILILQKLRLLCLTGLIALVLLMWKSMGWHLKNHLLRCWGCLSLVN